MNQSCFSHTFVAHALSPALLRICSVIKARTNWRTAALVFLVCVVAAAASSDSPAYAKFKREMMPKVGQKITVVGTWSDRTKQCCWLAFNHWGAYIHATNESGRGKGTDFFAHFRNGQMVKLTGTLRFYAGPVAPKSDVQNVPEQFFFDAAEVKMSLWSPTAQKNPKKEH
jgi:hypothetical protein